MLRLTLIRNYDDYCEWDVICHQLSATHLGLHSCKVTDPDLLQFAHIHGKETGLKGSGRGQYYRLKDVFDHPDCYVLLCIDHHREYDKEE